MLLGTRSLHLARFSLARLLLTTDVSPSLCTLRHSSDGLAPISPVARRADILSEWRKNVVAHMHERPLTSPFAPVRVAGPRDGLHHRWLTATKRHMKRDPDGRFFWLASNPQHHYTYKDVYEKAHSVNGWLRSHGFGRGDVACMVMANCIEYRPFLGFSICLCMWPVFCLGTLLTGGAVSGANALFTEFELEKQLRDSECRVVICDEDDLEKCIHIAPKIPRITHLICVRSPSSTLVLPKGVIDFAEVSSFAPDYEVATPEPGDMCLLPYSSGTTGSPKGVKLSHQGYATMHDIWTDHLHKEIGLMANDVVDWYKEPVFNFIPFSHMSGFGLLCSTIGHGMPSPVMGAFDPVLFLKTMTVTKPRFLFAVTPILVFLAKHPIAKQANLSSVEFVMTGAAPVGRDICKEFLAQYKHVRFLAQGYGMTETSMCSHLPLLEKDNCYEGIGVIASCFEQKIVDPDTKKQLGVNQVGELCVRGPTVMQGYLHQPEATAETIVDGWLHTGDIGYVDEFGVTFIVDRLKELIKVKANQVAPAELEDLLLSHSKIRDAAVIGIPDERRGETIRAYVVKGDSALTEDDVVQFIAERTAEYKHLTAGVIFVDQIPKAPSGKILRRILREKAALEAKR